MKWVKIKLLDKHHPIIEFLLYFSGTLRKGLNEYYNIYSEEIAEYPYEAVWHLPGKIIKINMAGDIRIEENILRVRVKKVLELVEKKE